MDDGINSVENRGAAGERVEGMNGLHSLRVFRKMACDESRDEGSVWAKA